jgi:hypothetical protein
MDGSATGESPPQQRIPPHLWLTRAFRFSLIATILFTILAIGQQFYGLGLTTRHAIVNSRIQKMDGYYRWRFPESYRTPLMESRAKFYEDGRRWINRSLASRDLPDLGPGWFHWIDGGVNFVPKEQGDPRRSTRHYSVVCPYQFKSRVWWILGTAILAHLLLLNHLRHSGRIQPLFSAKGLLWKQDASPNLRGELVIFVCALIAIFASLYSNRDLTDHAFMVKGLPESDAGGWYAMGIGLAEGHGLGGGFQNQRPFYSIYLGGLFTLLGIKLTVAQGFNALCLALSAAGLYSVGRIADSRWLGLVLSISAMAATTHLDYVHAIISENGGTVLAVLSLLSVWQAAWLLSPRWSFAAGLLNGLAALTSGVTLLTLPLYAIVLTLFPLTRRTPWRRAVQLGFLYTLAASLLVGGWILRQKIVNDRLTLSYNTAEVLAGGADLKNGHLSGLSFAQAEKAGVNLRDPNERYDYFMRTYKESVARDPAAYLRQVGRATIASIEKLPYRVAGFHLTLLLGLLGFGLWPALLRGQWIAFLAACLLMTFWVRSEFDVTPAMLLAATYLAWRRAATPAVRLVTLLLICTTLATMILSGLSGNVAPKRFWLVADWSAFALLLSGTKYLVVTVGTLAHQLLARCRAPAWLAGTPGPAPTPGAAFDAPPFISLASIAWIALSLTCAAATLTQHLRGPHSTLGPLDHIDPSAIARQGLQRLVSQNPGAPVLPPDRLTVQIARLGDLHAEMEAKEGTQHWLGIYGPRPYPRWIAKMAQLDTAGERTHFFNSLGQGSLDPVPRATPLVVVGILTDSIDRLDQSTVKLFEVCLIVPLKRPAEGSPWQPDYDHQIAFPPTPEALAAAAKPAQR